MDESKKHLWIVANWKSNKTGEEAVGWIDSVGPKLKSANSVSAVVCPVFSAIPAAKEAIDSGKYPLRLGAQNISPFDKGPYTGEEPAGILADLVSLSIIGHSERRKNFGETDQMIAEKVKLAKEYNILPLLCVQDQNTPVPTQVEMIAYEPVFAIGTGHPDTPENAQVVAKMIKEINPQLKGILYGGSVNSGNAKAFLEQPDIGGLLIGGASLDAEEFAKIVEIAYSL